jgi:anti-anti-sigma regulatory factor
MRAEFGELECPGGHAAVVRLAGALTIETVPAVRAALLKAVAGQPAMVLVDLENVTVPDDIVLTVFPAVARHAAAWPGIPLVLAQADAELAVAFDRTAVLRYVTIAESVRAACESAENTPASWRSTTRMANSLGSVPAARQIARDSCARWGVTGLAEAAELVACELVSNAVRHSGDMFEFSMAMRQRYLHVSVRDGSHAVPRMGRGDGRGLLLVDAMSVTWGSTPVHDGKVVWATLLLP